MTRATTLVVALLLAGCTVCQTTGLAKVWPSGAVAAAGYQQCADMTPVWDAMTRSSRREAMCRETWLTGGDAAQRQAEYEDCLVPGPRR